MKGEILQCPVCAKKREFFPITRVKNSRKYLKIIYFDYYQCSVCSLMILYPTVPITKVKQIYDKTYYKKLSDFLSNPFIQKLLELRFFKSYDEFVSSKFPKHEVLLDIGCGTGDFLVSMKKKGYEVFGLDPYVDSVRITSKKIGKRNVIRGYIKDINKMNKKFKIITLWHVLEHTYDPRGDIKAIYRSIEKNGALFLEVPSGDSFSLQLWKEYYAWHMVPEHNLYFTKKSLSLLLREVGFSSVTLYTPPRALLNFSYSMKNFLNEHIKNHTVAHCAFFISIPISISIGLISSFFGNGEVIRVVAKK